MDRSEILEPISARGLVRPPPLSSIVVPLLLILGISVAVGAALLFEALTVLKQHSREEMKERVDVAFDIESQRLADLVVEYTYWDQAYENLIVNTRPDWADGMIGSYMANEHRVDLSFAVNASNQVAIAYVSGKEAQIPYDQIYQSGLATALKRETNDNAPTQGIAFFFSFDGNTYLGALNSFAPEVEGSRPVDGSFLVIARQIDAEFVALLGQTYRIPQLQPCDEDELPGSLLKRVRDLDGNEVYRLKWQEPPLTALVTNRLTFPFAGIAAVMIALILMVVRIDFRKRQQYADLLYRYAHVDPLTGVSNRRDFYEQARRELNRSNRLSHPLTILMLDIDRFKSINDKFGHSVGDEVLVQTAKCLSGKLRDIDTLARVGGEEFVILLPETALDRGLDVAERLRIAVEEGPFGSGETRTHVTLSIGVAERKSDEELESLLNRADAALYRAKTSGRNRTAPAQSD